MLSEIYDYKTNGKTKTQCDVYYTNAVIAKY